MTDLLIAVVSGVVGLLGGGYVGYVFGVLRTLNERRDAALAEIFKEMDLFHCYLGSWANDPTPGPHEPTAESVDIPARKHVNDQYKKFVLAFHGNAIWLGEDTYNLIQEFSAESMDLLNGLNSMMAGTTHLPDGTQPNDWRKDQITPKFIEVRDALREEVEASSGLLAWFQYHIVNRKNA